MQFGRNAKFPLPPVIGTEGQLNVYPVNVELLFLDPMIALMRRPTRLEDAARIAPEAVKAAYGDAALRLWRDTLDEFLLVPAEQDEAEGEPPNKKQRVLNPYEKRLEKLGERLGDYILATHPNVERFLKGLDARLDMAILLAYYPGSLHQSFTLPPLDDPTDDVLAEQSFAHLFRNSRESDRVLILSGLQTKFPRSRVEHKTLLSYDPKSRKQASTFINTWPLRAHCHQQTEHVMELTLYY
jgi:hypothetical protein